MGALLAFLCGRRYYDFAMRYGASQITGPPGSAAKGDRNRAAGRSSPLTHLLAMIG